MRDYKKPLPKPTPWSMPFWQGCKEKKLLVQRCRECEKYIFYPKLFCPFCLSQELSWVEARGKGKIYSFTVVYSYQPTEFSDDVPYIIGVIELDEGVRMMSNVVECDPEKVRCDMDVEVVFDQVTDDFTFPRFRPVGF
ncbi:MAG: Zn-ribbon domain-containing OB-fold protein [Deltaproteobacteria bacterium]|nr:Zn-ribbon domain-containing OB-fold protein [Deltaproteobacteria bacterium]